MGRGQGQPKCLASNHGPRHDTQQRGKRKREHLRWGRTYSSRIKLPTEIPPQLMPPIMLPARLSLRARLAWSRFGLIMEMGLGPALTNESLRLRLMAESRFGPVVMSTSEGLLARSPPKNKSSGGLRKAGEEGMAIGLGPARLE